MFRGRYSMPPVAGRPPAAEAVGMLAGALFGLALTSVRGGMCALRGMAATAMWESECGCHDHARHGHVHPVACHHYHCECVPPCGTGRCC